MAATNFKEAGQPGSVVERKKRGEVESVQNKYPRKILFVSTKAVLLSNILPEGFSCSRVSGQQLTHVFIRAKRVCNCYIPKKKSARVRVCSTNLRFSVEKNVLVLVWGTYYVPHTHVPGTSERFVANCGVDPSTRGQGDSASLVKPTQDQRR